MKALKGFLMTGDLEVEILTLFESFIGQVYVGRFLIADRYDCIDYEYII